MYLPVTTSHVADVAWSGRIAEACRELCQWALVKNDSVWRLGAREVAFPLLAPHWQKRREERRSVVPDWLTRAFAETYDVRSRLATERMVSGRRGRHYDGSVARSLSRLANSLPAWHGMLGVEIRHPFLYLPLVEFSLRLPYQMRTRATRSKPILRAAMKGILPEEVRRRTTKSVFLRFYWAFGRERALLGRLMVAPVLADLGVIEPRRMVAAIDGWLTGVGRDPLLLYTALSLETWLAVRSGRCLVDWVSAAKKEDRHESQGGREGTRQKTLHATYGR